MRAIWFALLASGASGARVGTQKDDLQRESTHPGYLNNGADPLADIELPVRLTARQRAKDRTSLRFIRHMLTLAGTDNNEAFCPQSTDNCSTIDGFPGHDTHTEMRFDHVVEELAKTPEREVRGEIRRLGDLGYLIFNDLLWANDWKTFPIGADLEDHRKHRPTADLLMGSDSPAWNRATVRRMAEHFFEGRESLNQRDMNRWIHKLFHKLMLDMDITDEEETDFAAYKSSSTTISTLPRWLVSGFRWAVGLNAAREKRDEWLARYVSAIDADTRGIIPQLDDPRDKRFLADFILTAITSAGGLSTPTVMSVALGALHGASAYEYGEVLPADQRRLTNSNIEQLVLESVRRFPVVVGFPWWDPENLSFRTVMNVAMSLRDPRAWEGPKEFRLRPLSEYHERRGMGTKIGTAWAQQAQGNHGLTPDSRGCPGQELSVVISTEFLRAYMATQDEWSVAVMPEGGLQITEGPTSVNDFTITRNGAAPVNIDDPVPMTIPAPENDDEEMAESASSWWR